MRKLFRDRLLLGIVSGGLLVRIAFLLVGAKLYYSSSQSNIYTNGDTHSYVLSFVNLIKYGFYTFDFLQPDAAFGRLPGYPFFYGLHYLVFGSRYAAAAVACSQVLIDCASIGLMYGALRRIWPTSRWTPYVGSSLYAFYPFAIVWVTIVGTETLGIFLVLAWLCLLLRERKTAGYFVGLGLLVAMALFVREYLGVLLPLTLVYLAAWEWKTQGFRFGRLVRIAFFVGLGFGMLYAAWPIRNYLSLHRMVWVKTPTAGYANYNVDFASFRAWVQCWSNDEQHWLDVVAAGTEPIRFPAEAFDSPHDRNEALRLANLARRCGTSFYLYRTKLYATPQYFDVAAMRANKEYQQNCNTEISAGFMALKTEFARRHPARYWLQVPGQNLAKAFFKNSKTREQGSVGARQLLISVLFGYRTLLLLLAVVGFVVFRRNLGLLPPLLFFGFMYLFISFIMRNMEMRYLLQADVLSLVPAAGLLGYWLDRRWPRHFPSLSS